MRVQSSHVIYPQAQSLFFILMKKNEENDYFSCLRSNEIIRKLKK